MPVGNSSDSSSWEVKLVCREPVPMRLLRGCCVPKMRLRRILYPCNSSELCLNCYAREDTSERSINYS